MEIYDIAVTGAGPAGCMAAIRGAQLGKKVILLERNDKIGRKLLLTANGRCNLTNTAPFEVFLEMFGKRGSFYREIFSKFSNQDLMDFFKKYGLKLKEEDNGRLFPITDDAKSVVDVLKRVLDVTGVNITYKFRLNHLKKDSDIFTLSSKDNKSIQAHNVILATGGTSYKFTGSTGDGFKIAESLGHHISQLNPSGVPLLIGEEWIHELQGITLEDVGLSIGVKGKIKSLPRGRLLLTHFGISGPVILDLSHNILDMMDENSDLTLYVDFKPDVSIEGFEENLMSDFLEYSRKSLKNYLQNHLPHNMVLPILECLSIDPQKKLNQITKKERKQLLKTIKSLPLTITGSLPSDKAMVTCTGVSKKEINPQTTESKLVKNLYFAGEIIAGCGRRGGYNLQQAFSTGYVAGESASHN
ncbi:MAG: NAD(P)/FAD-dependent oxidoreductase [Methanobacterium sp.]|nr:NAD(P)/FAD-dependent oxidoreductase [Methanobacterium sp.]